MPAVVDCGGHTRHEALASAGLYCPVEQFSHSIAPGPSLKVPGMQAVHADAASPVYPALQRQWAALVLAGVVDCGGHMLHEALASAGLYCPVGQFSHSIAPPPSLKVPGMQAVHADAASPVYPALQRQWAALVLAGAAFVECAGHCSHLSTIFCTLIASVPSTKPCPQDTCQFCGGTVVKLL